jgi:hypothetical protein
MRCRRRSVLVVAAALVLFTAVLIVLRSPVAELDAAPNRELDWPRWLAANANGDLYVGYVNNSDFAGYVLRRISADHVMSARWEVACHGSSIYDRFDISESGEGGVFVGVDDMDVVLHYTSDGLQTAQWPAQDLLWAIATAPRVDTRETEVYALASRPGDDLVVRRYGPEGDVRSTVAVAENAIDLTVWPATATEGPDLFVAAGSEVLGSSITRYRADGTKVSEWSTRGIAGLDVDPAGGHVWVGLVAQRFSRTGAARAYSRDGTPGTECDLTVDPRDLTIAPTGDLYILGWDAGAKATPTLVRYRQDCTLVDTWDLWELNYGTHVMLYLPSVLLRNWAGH